MHEKIALDGEYIELNKLLKLLNLSFSGGEAKNLIADGLVSVDGDVETRKRRKIRSGSVVKLGSVQIDVE